MKKQIKEKRFSFIIIIIFSFSILATNSSCKKETNAETGKIASPPGSTIIYTDINPDTLLSSSQTIYNLDLNKDGITDFVFRGGFYISVCGDGYSIGVTNLSVEPANENNAILNDGASHAYVLDSTVAIVPGSPWANTSQVLLIGGRGSSRCLPSIHRGGYWVNVSDKYLGLKFIKGNNTYYGWAKLSSSYYYTPDHQYQLSRGQLTIKDYAYNSSPNQPILAGQTK